LKSNSNKATYKEFFGGLGTILCDDCRFVFWEFLTPFILGGYNFFISNPFSIIVSVSDVPREGVSNFAWTPKTTETSLWSLP
jgi:hypothetical protein